MNHILESTNTELLELERQIAHNWRMKNHYRKCAMNSHVDVVEQARLMEMEQLYLRRWIECSRRYEAMRH